MPLRLEPAGSSEEIASRDNLSGSNLFALACLQHSPRFFCIFKVCNEQHIRDGARTVNCESMRQTLVHSGGKLESIAFDRLDRELRDPHVSGPEFDFDGTPLFWLELFDLSTKTSVDGFSCHRIKDAVPIFDDFISQAGLLNEPGGARQ